MVSSISLQLGSIIPVQKLTFFLCSTKDGIIVYLKHLAFKQPIVVYDPTTVPVKGQVKIMESDGCPLIGATVCIEFKRARVNDVSKGPCVKTDSQGNYVIGAAIGSAYSLHVSYNNHTSVKAPENVYDYSSGT